MDSAESIAWKSRKVTGNQRRSLVYVAEKLSEGNRTPSGYSEPPSGPSFGRNNWQEDHSQNYEPTERTYYFQDRVQTYDPSRNEHYQPIESYPRHAKPTRNADSTLGRIHWSPL
jgi:hypothetical protein